MIFKSLLFDNEIKAASISNEVFCDLKIDGILKPYACNLLSYFPSTQTCLRRGELFAMLESSDDFKSYLASVADKANECANIKKAYENAYLPASRALLCARMWNSAGCLIDSIVDTDIPLVPLMAKIKESAVDFLEDNDTKAMLELAKSACEQANIPKYMLTIKGNSFEYATFTQRESMLEAINSAVGTSYHAKNYSGDYDEMCEELLKLDESILSKATEFYAQYNTARIDNIADFANELNLLFDLLELYSKTDSLGIPHVYPTYNTSATIQALDAYDITLLAKNENNIVPNDIMLDSDTRFCFLCGANGGGKTTYLRTIGINTILALCGFPVCAKSMDICAIDGIYTHFPHDENFQGEGRYANEKRRVDEMKANFGSMPLVLLNETYSTTTEDKSTAETKLLAQELNQNGVYGVYVTHAADIDVDGVQNLEVIIDKDDNNRRTYKVAKSGQRTLSYAKDILKKYSLDKASLMKKYGGAK